MIQVVVRAIDILEFVAQHKNKPVPLSRIAAHLQINVPTCANIVKTLVDKNYLENAGRKQGYILGVNLFRLTGNVSYNQDLVQESKDIMDELASKLNETCLLGVIRNNKRIILHEAKSDQDLQVRTRIESDIYPTATGRVLIAFLPEKEREKLIDAIGLPEPEVWPGIKTREDLANALQKIRKEQFVQTLSSKHIVGIAVPLMKKNQAVAALSIFLPESRFSPTHRENIFKQLFRAAKKIRERLNAAE